MLEVWVAKLARALRAAMIGWWEFVSLFALICAVALIVEWLRPAQRGQPWRNVLFNLLYTAIYGLMTRLVLIPVSFVIGRSLAGRGGWLDVELPPTFAGQLGLTLGGLLIFDFFYYWFHRAQHRWSALWALHKVHHADPSVNATTTYRHHWLEEPFRAVLVGLPLGLLVKLHGGVADAAGFGLAVGLWGYFIHMNLRLDLGPLTPVLAGPQLHRIHHSNVPQHVDRNFAAYFPVWDVVFGTYLRPGPNEYPATGTHDGEDLNGVVRASLAPFQAWFGRRPAVAAGHAPSASPRRVTSDG
jgi:sterol desaturase/sphingolipid hydroxylase (fatty acid hydroxylase superfamily)